MRSGWHGAQAQGWRGHTDARAAGEAGNPLGPPSFAGSLTSPPPPPLSLTHSLSKVSGSFMLLPAPSHAPSPMEELIHVFTHSFTYPTDTSQALIPQPDLPSAAWPCREKLAPASSEDSVEEWWQRGGGSTDV